jgi:hypothetical protein
MNDNLHIAPRDVDILRRLAERKAEISRHPTNTERRNAWLKHNTGPGGRVMVLAEHGGVQDPNRPVPDSWLECEGKWARELEMGLRTEIYLFEMLKDDHVIEPRITTNWQVAISDYGVKTVVHHGDNDDRMGSWSWDPPIADLDRDFDKLKARTFSVNREATFEARAVLEEVFGGILDIQIRGGFYWTMGMTWPAIDLIGLENLMVFMYDNPAGLHRLMTFLRDDHVALAKWLEAEGLCSLNNENDYIGSGSLGYTTDLPQPDYAAAGCVRAKDLWVLVESQETVGVGPDQFEEFIFPYQLSVAELFGKTYYGCCEPVHSRWHILKRIPNLSHVSVSPWAEQEFMAQEVGTRWVYSRKPNPTLISTPQFDENAIRKDIRDTLEIAKGCRVEIIMKDVHTLNNEPERLSRWVEIARQEIGKHT